MLDSYSAIESSLHNADQVVIFSCYLDDSYDQLSSVVTLAGYVAPRNAWREFEDSVNSTFSNFGVNLLHTKDLRGSKGEFKNWTRQQKLDFIKSIYESANGLDVVGVSCSVTKGLHKKFKQANKKLSGQSPLSMCFGQLVALVCEGEGMPFPPSKRKTAFFVEAGNHNNSSISSHYNQQKNQGRFDLSESLAFLDKTACRAINLADFWALYSRRLAKEVLNSNDDKNPVDFMEPELKFAADHVPHLLSVTHGGITQDIHNRNILQVGTTRKLWLSPIA